MEDPEDLIEPNASGPSVPVVSGRASVDAAHRDPAASMLLLTNIEKYALDPSYRLHAENKRPAKHPFVRNILVFVGVVSLAWIATVSAVNLRLGLGSESDPRAVLAEEVSVASERVDEIDVEVEAVRAKLRGAEVSEGFSVALPLDIALASATSRVEGPGVVVTLEDGSPAGNRSGLVRDSDVRSIMNLLWAGGAEAISIDGNRVGPGTTVRTAGSVILVNLTPVASPYVIEAIGDPASLLNALQSGDGQQQVRNIEKSLGTSLTIARQDKLKFNALPPPQLWSIDTEAEKGEGST